MKTNSIVQQIALLILVQTVIVAIYFTGPEIDDSEGRIKNSKILQSG